MKPEKVTKQQFLNWKRILQSRKNETVILHWLLTVQKKKVAITDFSQLQKQRPSIKQKVPDWEKGLQISQIHYASIKDEVEWAFCPLFLHLAPLFFYPSSFASSFLWFLGLVFFFFFFLVFGFWFLVFGFWFLPVSSSFSSLLCVSFPLWSLFASFSFLFRFFFKVFHPTPPFLLIVLLWLLF